MAWDAFATPGPLLITAASVEYVVAGVPGALAATLGIFLAPTVLATIAAQGVERVAQNRWLRAFNRGATPAVVVLLCVTLATLARHAAGEAL